MSEKIKCDSKRLRKNALTKRQREVLEFIKKCICERGIVPTIREIAEEIGIHSPNGVVGHLVALQKKGFIDRKMNASRAIVLKDSPHKNFIPMIEGVLKERGMYTSEEMQIDVPSWIKHSITSIEHRIIVVCDNEYEAKYGIRENDYLLIQPAKIPERERLNLVRNNDGTYDILRFDEVTNQRFLGVFAVVVALLRNHFDSTPSPLSQQNS